MPNFHEQKHKALELLRATADLAGRHGRQDTAARLSEAARHLDEGKLVVVVAGEFKQGKSSLMNALVGETDLFPVDVDITTNLVSSITYGPRESITVLLGERGKETSRAISRAEVADYVTEQRNKGNQRRARMLLIESPNPRLQDGLTLVDTPGVGSLNAEHTEITYAIIPNADAVLFVTDAFEPLSQDELDFIARRILPHAAPIIFVITKTDAVRNYGTVVENNREKLAAVTGRTPDSLTLIPVSSLLKLRHLGSPNPDPEDLEDSNFPALEAELLRLLNQDRGSLLLLRAVREIGEALGELGAPLRAEWEAYQHTSQAQVDAQEQGYAAAQQRLQDLLGNNAEWLTQLNYGIEDIRVRITDALRHGFVRLRRDVDGYLDDDRLLKAPDNIVGLLGADVDGLIAELGKQLSREAAALHGRLVTLTGLEISVLAPSLAAPHKHAVASGSREEPGWWERTLAVQQQALFKSTTGTAVGSLIGGVVGGVIGAFFGVVGAVPGAQIGSSFGALLGGIGGYKTGTRLGFAQLKAKDREQVGRIVARYLDDAQASCAQTMTQAVTDLNRSTRGELTAQIKREKETAERTVAAVKEARRNTQEQMAERSRVLQPQIQQLARLGALMQAVAEAAIALREPGALIAAPREDADRPKAADADRGDWADA